MAYNDGDRVEANYPQGGVTYEETGVDPSFLCSVLFFSLSIFRVTAEKTKLYIIKNSQATDMYKRQERVPE